MRAVKAAQNVMLKQQLAEVNPKYKAGPNELELEPDLKILQPTNAEQLKQLTTLVEALRRQNLGDQAWQNALRMWQMQITTGALSDQVKFEFVRRFYFWLLGRGTTDDVKRTFWGRGNAAVINREVALYIEQFGQRRLDYALQIALLANRVPDTLNGYYLYFKYIVNGKLKRSTDGGSNWWTLSDDDYLQDFELFQQEFDAQNNRPTYKDVIRPGAENGGFDASRPYPDSEQSMGSHQHKPKTNQQMVQQAMNQNSMDVTNSALPQANDPVENGMRQPPVRSQPANSAPTPSGEAAVGIGVSQEVQRLLGEALMPIRLEQRQMTQQVQQEREQRQALQATVETQRQQAAAREVEYARQQGIKEESLRKLREELQTAKTPAAATADVAGIIKQEVAQALGVHTQRLADVAQGIATTGAAAAQDLRLAQGMLQTLRQQDARQPGNAVTHDAANDATRLQIMTTAVMQAIEERWGPRGPPPPGGIGAAVAAPSDRMEAEKRQWMDEVQKGYKDALAANQTAVAQLSQDLLGKLGDGVANMLEQFKLAGLEAKRGHEAAEEVHFVDPRPQAEAQAAQAEAAATMHKAAAHAATMAKQAEVLNAELQVAEAKLQAKQRELQQVKQLAQQTTAEKAALFEEGKARIAVQQTRMREVELARKAAEAKFTAAQQQAVTVAQELQMEKQVHEQRLAAARTQLEQAAAKSEQERRAAQAELQKATAAAQQAEHTRKQQAELHKAEQEAIKLRAQEAQAKADLEHERKLQAAREETQKTTAEAKRELGLLAAERDQAKLAAEQAQAAAAKETQRAAQAEQLAVQARAAAAEERARVEQLEKERTLAAEKAETAIEEMRQQNFEAAMQAEKERAAAQVAARMATKKQPVTKPAFVPQEPEPEMMHLLQEHEAAQESERDQRIAHDLQLALEAEEQQYEQVLQQAGEQAADQYEAANPAPSAPPYEEVMGEENRATKARVLAMYQRKLERWQAGKAIAMRRQEARVAAQLAQQKMAPVTTLGKTALTEPEQKRIADARQQRRAQAAEAADYAAKQAEHLTQMFAAETAFTTEEAQVLPFETPAGMKIGKEVPQTFEEQLETTAAEFEASKEKSSETRAQEAGEDDARWIKIAKLLKESGVKQKQIAAVTGGREKFAKRAGDVDHQLRKAQLLLTTTKKHTFLQRARAKQGGGAIRHANEQQVK